MLNAVLGAADGLRWSLRRLHGEQDVSSFRCSWTLIAVRRVHPVRFEPDQATLLARVVPSFRRRATASVTGGNVGELLTLAGGRPTQSYPDHSAARSQRALRAAARSRHRRGATGSQVPGRAVMVRPVDPRQADALRVPLSRRAHVIACTSGHGDRRCNCGTEAAPHVGHGQRGISYRNRSRSGGSAIVICLRPNAGCPHGEQHISCRKMFSARRATGEPVAMVNAISQVGDRPARLHRPEPCPRLRDGWRGT